jgi:hypothetical protein
MSPRTERALHIQVDWKRTRRPAASAEKRQDQPEGEAGTIPTGITINGLEEPDRRRKRLSRTVISENVSLLFSLACSAASRAFSC